jgi:hypothetical protein
MTSALRMRMQPDEALCPMVQGSFEPWMRHADQNAIDAMFS